MLDQLIILLTTAEQLADRTVDLCRRGEQVDNTVAELSDAVAALVAGCPKGLPAELHSRWLDLTERVANATRAAQARTNELAAELEQTVRQDRIRRAYTRPSG